MLVERIAKLIPEYQQMFADRGDVTPSDALEFHFYHLARYWSRLLGFSRNSTEPKGLLSSDLAACVQVASDCANRIIGNNSPIYDVWQNYRERWRGLLLVQSVSADDIEAVSSAFDECLAALKFDPWARGISNS
jgi:hypothetical protein